MSYLKAAVAVILALKDIAGLIIELVKVFAIKKEKAKEAALVEAIDASKSAGSKEEMQAANEKAASNLP